MSTSKLPERASLDYLRKLAKERLHELRAENPRAQLAAAQLAIAREHGQPSWRALRAEVEKQRAAHVAAFFEACVQGDLAAVRRMLDAQPTLVGERRAPHGQTALHLAAAAGQEAVVGLLLERGADANARDTGDNAGPLHFAAAHGHIEIVRALLGAGADVVGRGDLHEAEVIGWVTALAPPTALRLDLLELLLQRGARHHIFSAVAVGDPAVVRALVEDSPETLDRRMSRFERRLSALHFAAERGRPDLVQLLIDLGADLEAEDAGGQTPLAAAMLRGDRDAVALLRAAGAREPDPGPSGLPADMASVARSVRHLEPMLRVPDVRAAVAWYRSVGFTLKTSHEDGGELVFARLALGTTGFALSSGGAARDVTLWFTVDDIERIHRLFRQRQLRDPALEVRFLEDLYEPFYGGRQFSVGDPNGVALVFHELDRPSSTTGHR